MDKNKKISLAAEYFQIAYDSHLQGELDTAIESYKTSIRIHPTPKAYTLLGWAYSLQGDYENAIEECKKAIELDPEFGNPYNDIGSYLIALNRNDEAIYWLEQAIAAAVNEARHYPYYNLGRIHEKRGEWILAAKMYRKSIDIEPDYELAEDAFIRITTLLN